MHTYTVRPVPCTFPRAALYADDAAAAPLAEVYSPEAVPMLAAAPVMVAALRSAEALLTNPDAEAADADLCLSIVRNALREAGAA